mmetsp:Transcript_55894/g.166263  ORF Transcript_55894/g.166263 Transcript_55894/m.166263 type:complete len:281 (+) Transcript_55894:719-1561(+)
MCAMSAHRPSLLRNALLVTSSRHRWTNSAPWASDARSKNAPHSTPAGIRPTRGMRKVKPKSSALWRSAESRCSAKRGGRPSPSPSPSFSSAPLLPPPRRSERVCMGFCGMSPEEAGSPRSPVSSTVTPSSRKSRLKASGERSPATAERVERFWSTKKSTVSRNAGRAAAPTAQLGTSPMWRKARKSWPVCPQAGTSARSGMPSAGQPGACDQAGTKESRVQRTRATRALKREVLRRSLADEHRIVSCSVLNFSAERKKARASRSVEMPLREHRAALPVQW